MASRRDQSLYYLRLSLPHSEENHRLARAGYFGSVIAGDTVWISSHRQFALNRWKVPLLDCAYQSYLNAFGKNITRNQRCAYCQNYNQSCPIWSIVIHCDLP
jgi:hypothetical protein